MSIKEILDFLLKNDYLDYGVILNRELLEKLFGCKYKGNITYKFLLLELKLEIEKLGFLCTQAKCCDSEMRILKFEEMSHKSKRIRSNTFKKNKRLLQSLMNANPNTADEKILNKFEHEKNKTFTYFYSMQSVLSSVNI